MVCAATVPAANAWESSVNESRKRVRRSRFANIFKPLLAYARPDAHPFDTANRRKAVMTSKISSWKASRRCLLLRASALGITSLLRMPAQAGVGDQPSNASSTPTSKARNHMSTIITKNGTEIFYKDWGKGQPIVFHHGWPLSADDWDNQMMFFLSKGYRVIAHDRRGHGRSSQTDKGNDMDTYAADVSELVTALGLTNAIHIGHSTGGGEVTRYVAQHGNGRVAKAVLISAIPPVMVKSEKNPGGTPLEAFDGYRNGLAANRAQFYIDVPAGPFYGFNRPGAKVVQGAIDNWWRQGMMGGIKAHYDCIKVFSETDHTEDLKKITVPVLVMHSEDDQIVPVADAGPLSAKLLKNGTLKVYKDLPHGMPTTHPEIINADLLAFIQG
jgi:non-heme chloroperoxidase